MKTTVEISDALLEEAKRLARERGTTLRAVLEAALRRELSAPAEPRKKLKFRDRSFKGGVGLQPGIDLSDWSQIRRIIYEARRVIAVDTNLLIYAHRPESPWHEAAKQCLDDLLESESEWAIPWPCLHEFLAIVTRSTIFKEPTQLEAAVAQVDEWLEAPFVTMLGEGPGYWPELRDLITEAKVTGAMIHDARIAAICLQHDAELWSADRDFARFPGLLVRNPLVGDQLAERASRYGRRRRRA